MNKKAMSINFMVSAILILASFIVIAGALANFLVQSDERDAENICRSSIALRAATSLNIKEAKINTVPVFCKTIDKKIKGDKEEVMKQFADNMVKCWQMFGEGKYEQNIFDNLNIMGGTKRCFMCYTLMVDESSSFKKGDKITPEEFKDFLVNTNHPKLKGTTYLNYFQTYGGKGIILGVLSEQGITPGHAYAVGYKSKANKCSWCSGITTGGGALAAAGLVTVILAPVTGGGSLIGTAAIVAGTTASLTAGGIMITEEFFKEVDINSIYLVDISSQQMNLLFEKSCEKIEEDVGGK